jgi:hypothetical protein
LAQLHAVLQVAFGWSDTHLYTFLIRGGQFSDRDRGMELAIAGGADIPLAAFGFEISEPFCYRYNLFVPWEIDCRVKGRCLISREQWVACMGAQGYPPDEDLRAHEVVERGIGLRIAGGRSGILTTTRLIYESQLPNPNCRIFDIGGPASSTTWVGGEYNQFCHP